MAATEHDESPSPEAGPWRTEPSLRSLSSLVAALAEAVGGGGGGEVIAKSAGRTGRVFVSGGRIAWAVTNLSSRTFRRHLVQTGLVQDADLNAVFEECKRTGRNFAETIVAWGLLSEERLRRELLEDVAGALVEILAWPGCVAMFVPSARVYAGKLTFQPVEVLTAAAGLDPEQRSPARWLAAQLGGGEPAEELAALLERIRRSPGLPVSAPTPVEDDWGLPPEPAQAAGRAAPLDGLVNATDLLQRLREVDGYRASGAFGPGAGLLCWDSVDGVTDRHRLVDAAATFLAEARAQVEAAWAPLRETVLLGDLGALVLRCCEVPAFGRLGVFLLLRRADQVGVARLQLERLLPELIAEAV